MRFSITTYGCQMNKHDSDRLAALLEARGHERVSEAGRASLLVFNTCCVREGAENRLLGNVAALRPLKQNRKDMIIAITGCLAQKDALALTERLPHVDIVTGTANWSALPDLVEDAMAGGGPIICVGSAAADGQPDALRTAPAADYGDPGKAWVAISSGCDNHCSYCIVPRVRGPEQSKPMDAVMTEIDRLVSGGVKEVTLLGQNVNSYGRDIYGAPRFAQLLSLAAARPGLKRLRFTTSHPKDFTVEVAAAMGSHPTICRHVHLPVQSGSTAILEAMGRGYTKEQYIQTADMIRSTLPGVAVTTDIMVGFPGETEDDFQATLEVVERVGFEQAFMFIYSPRPGTPAAEMAGQVSGPVKKERFTRLVEAQHKQGMRRNQAEVGKEYQLYIEGLSKKGEHNLAGRTGHNKLVHVRGAGSLVGSYVEASITQAHSWFLIGELGGQA